MKGRHHEHDRSRPRDRGRDRAGVRRGIRRVYAYWTEPEALARWFAPGDYTTVAAEVDARPGGAWRLDFRSGDGRHEYTEHGAFLELDPPRRLQLTLTQVDGGKANPETVVTVEFDDVGTADAPRTRMTFRQTGYDDVVRRDQNAEGWRGCFAKLEGALGSQRFGMSDFKSIDKR